MPGLKVQMRCPNSVQCPSITYKYITTPPYADSPQNIRSQVNIRSQCGMLPKQNGGTGNTLQDASNSLQLENGQREARDFHGYVFCEELTSALKFQSAS